VPTAVTTYLLNDSHREIIMSQRGVVLPLIEMVDSNLAPTPTPSIFVRAKALAFTADSIYRLCHCNLRHRAVVRSYQIITQVSAAIVTLAPVPVIVRLAASERTSWLAITKS
jgi:hypothetical protein